MQNDNKKIINKKRLYIMAITILLTICIGAGTMIFLNQFKGDGGFDASAQVGQLEGKSADEIQAELNRVVEDGMFNISINACPIYKNGKAEGNIRIENVPSNRYLMKVIITLDDNNEEVYKTDFIEPNYHIQNAKLDKVLSKGEYAATATFNAYNIKTKEYVGSSAAKINIIIQS